MRGVRCSVSKISGCEQRKPVRGGQSAIYQEGTGSRVAEKTGSGEADEQRYKASVRQTSRCCILAQSAEVEVGGDSVGVGRVDLDSDVLRREGFGGEFELNGGADEVAAAFIAVIIGMTVVRRGLERFVVGENGD